MRGLALIMVLLCAASFVRPQEDPYQYCKTIQCPAVVYRLYPSPDSECWYCVCYWGKVYPAKCDPGLGYDPSTEGCAPNEKC